jgi:hypothetical protein
MSSRTTGESVLPNFLVVGAGAAGTTELCQYLRQHPQLYMSRHKQPRFFALYGRPVNFRGPGDMTELNLVADLGAYQQLVAEVQDEKAIGEVSPWYLYVETAAPAIRKLLPDVKLVAILRDPVDRAFSNYLHAVNEGLEPLPTFRDAMDAEEVRIRDNWSPRFHYKSKGFYYQQLQHYLEYFDRGQLRIYLYEDLVNEPEAMLADLFEFLGVDPELRVDVGKRHDESRPVRGRPVRHLPEDRNILRRGARRLVPTPLRAAIRDRLIALNTGGKPRLSGRDRRDFIEIYRADIAKLEMFLGCDLSGWRT